MGIAKYETMVHLLCCCCCCSLLVPICPSVVLPCITDEDVEPGDESGD